MLTSAKNPRIQHIRKLQSDPHERRAAGLFAAEGVRLLEEAVLAGWKAELVLAVEDLGLRGAQLLERFRSQGSEVLTAAPEVLRAASDTQTPQGILALFPIPRPEPPAALTFALLADGMRDPGNLGTLLRTAVAAGVQAVILPPGAVDPYSPKVVRAAMGAHFRLPILALPWAEILSLTRARGLAPYLADAAGGIAYTQADFRTPLLMIIGGEASGAGSEIQALPPTRVHIPMPGPAESLNAAVAAAILLFEVVRQRQP